MDNEEFQRILVRCRLLLTRSALHRLAAHAGSNPRSDRERFLIECHFVYKKALKILTGAILLLENETEAREKQKLKSDDLRYQARILEFVYDSFVWIAANHDRSNVIKIYKSRKFGSLSAQNIQSAIEAADELNQDALSFAFPLDFSRFSCIGDLLRIRRDPAG